MGVDIKTLKNRIKSVDSTLHLTKAMGLVASAKIRSATKAMMKSRDYSDAVSNTVAMLSSAKACEKSVYMQKRDTGKTCVIAFAGDRGLAGGYNANIFRLCDEVKPQEVFAIGKRACDRFLTETVGVEGYSYAEAIALAKKLCDGYKSGEYSKVGIISTKYQSMMTQTPEVDWIFPLSKAEKKSRADIIFEPDEKTVLESVIEEYVAAKLVAAARESFTCEVVARRFAMDNAGKNAGEMIDSLKLEYNRARQGAITQEITEIVAGSGS